LFGDQLSVVRFVLSHPRGKCRKGGDRAVFFNLLVINSQHLGDAANANDLSDLFEPGAIPSHP
jgi:hypothetical protein